jgi:hypothetical protein
VSDSRYVVQESFVLHIRDIRDHLQREKLLTNSEMRCEDVIERNMVHTSETQKRKGTVAKRANRL